MYEYESSFTCEICKNRLIHLETITAEVNETVCDYCGTLHDKEIDIKYKRGLYNYK